MYAVFNVVLSFMRSVSFGGVTLLQMISAMFIGMAAIGVLMYFVHKAGG